MEAGRELDALVAEWVFEYTLDYEFAHIHTPPVPHIKELRDQYNKWGMLPYYSTDANAAMEVVKRVIRARGVRIDFALNVGFVDVVNGYGVHFEYSATFTTEMVWCHKCNAALIAPELQGVPHLHEYVKEVIVSGHAQCDEASHAICLAALQAVGVNIDAL